MIDWITAHIVTDHPIIPVGKVLSISPDGEEEWSVDKHLPVSGSFESRIMLKTVHTKLGPAVRLHGNPVKFLQGHNLFGSSNIMGLLGQAYRRIQSLQPELQLPDLGIDVDIDITRIDIARMYKMQCSKDVQRYIHHMAKTSRSRCGTGQFAGDTLYFQKRSKRWAVKMYDKEREIQKHKIPLEIQSKMDLSEYADSTLRIEVTLRKKELDTMSDEKFNLLMTNPDAIFDEYYGRLTMTENVKVPNEKLRDLSPAIRAIYYDWLHGENPKATMKRPTFYKYRRHLLDNLGVDISVPCQDPEIIQEQEKETLKPVPIPSNFVPDFARGTSLYADPDSHQQQLRLANQNINH